MTASSKDLPAEQLVPGHTYLLDMSDCCITGVARDRFVRLNYWDETHIASVEFEHITLTDWGQVGFQEPTT